MMDRRTAISALFAAMFAGRFVFAQHIENQDQVDTQPTQRENLPDGSILTRGGAINNPPHWIAFSMEGLTGLRFMRGKDVIEVKADELWEALKPVQLPLSAPTPKPMQEEKPRETTPYSHAGATALPVGDAFPGVYRSHL